MSPSLIILGQSVVYPEVVAKQTGPTGETTDSPLHLLNPYEILVGVLPSPRLGSTFRTIS